jgi:hypothetical protein
LKHTKSKGKHKPNKEAVRSRDAQNIEKYRVETRGCAVHKDQISQASNENELQKRPQGEREDEPAIKGHGRRGEKLRQEASQAGREEPGEKHERNGDFISVKLGDEFPYGDQLYSDGGYPGSDDRPYDQSPER